MKKKVIAVITTVFTASTVFAACGNTQTTVENAVAETPTEVEEAVAETETVVEETETETETHEHEFTEANYQEPATCIICGETEGEPLKAGYEEKGIKTVSEWDTPYEYVTQWAGTDDDVTIQAEFTNCQRMDGDEEAGLEPEEGYEWVTFDLIWTEEGSGGAALWEIEGDYYDEGKLYETSEDNRCTVNFHGIDYQNCELKKEQKSQGSEGNVYKTVVRYAQKVPVGYDGITVVLLDEKTANQWSEGSRPEQDTNENALFFRVMP